MSRPAVSVIMSAYNCRQYVSTAVESILSQKFTNFELIIINDGSTDGTEKVLRSYKDKRIHLVDQPNHGLVYSLNKGIRLANADLIARHDADDASLPTRLEKQVARFADDNQLVLCGSSMRVMNMSGEVLHTHYVLLNNTEIKQELLVRSPFAHGSVMFRRNAFQQAGGYMQEEWPAEDYGLWLRMAPFGTFANIDEALYVYRENEHGISQKNAQRQQQRTHATQREARNNTRNLVGLSPDTAPYKTLAMGQFRISRIANNYIFGIQASIRHGAFLSALRCAWILFHNRDLRRKCARLILVKTGLENEA